MASSVKSNGVILGYLAIRGKAGVLRNLLAYCQLPWENKLYPDTKEWFNKDKQQLGFAYPNLPYIIDGQNKITETYAIMHYIPIKANRRDLIGESKDQFIHVQTALNVVRDVRDGMSKLIWTKADFNTELEEAFTKGLIKAKLDVLNKNLQGNENLCGFLSIADFQLFETLDMIHEIDASRLEKYPELLAFRQRFLEIPQVKAHRQSKDFIKTWFPATAAWNNTK